jgi:hypothetical protein
MTRPHAPRPRLKSIYGKGEPAWRILCDFPVLARIREVSARPAVSTGEWRPRQPLPAAGGGSVWGGAFLVFQISPDLGEQLIRQARLDQVGIHPGLHRKRGRS